MNEIQARKISRESHKTPRAFARSLLCVALLSGVAVAPHATARARVAPSAPLAPLPKPPNIRCMGWAEDTVVIGWDDTAPDETAWKVERKIGGGSYSEVASIGANQGRWDDTGADVSSQNRVYRVRSYRSGDTSYSPYSDECNNRHINEYGPFRIFYGLRGTSDLCPLRDGQEVCTAATSFVDLEGNALIGSRAAFSRVGFLLDAGTPCCSLDKIPINIVWCDGGGCAGGGGLGLSPWLIEFPFNLVTRVGDPGPYIVAEHELFHFLQGSYGGLSEPDGGWVTEGQARSTQDKICLGADRNTANCFDDIAGGYAGYVPEVKNYLGNPNEGLRLASYRAALFWTYLTEKFGTSNPSDQTEGRMNLMVEFWEAASGTPGNDAVTNINAAISALGGTAVFKDIFKDFIIANVAKDLTNGSVPAKYKYADETQPPFGYGAVTYAISQTLNLGGGILDTDETVKPWGARYYQVRPSADVPVIPITITQDTLTPLYYVVLGIKADGIAYEQRYEQRNLALSLVNDNYERVVVIVAGLDNLGNYRIAINGTQPQLRILSPTTNNKARVGDKNSPEKFLAQLEVVGGDGAPLPGIDIGSFSFQIGATAVPASNIVASSTIQGQHWFVIQAVTQTANTTYNFVARYSTLLTGTQANAINYVPRTDADNVLVIDRSGSMGDFGKMDSAQKASRLYVDSWRTGDKIAVESFNENVTVDLTLRNWTTDPPPVPIGSREEAFNVIASFVALGGTAIGDALLAGWEELKARGVNAHDWALVLVSDGMETAGTKTFGDAIKAIKDSTDKKPVVHTVAIGPDADRIRMQQAANDTGGTYQYVSAPAGPLSLGTDAPSIPNDDVLLMPLNIDAKYRAIAANVLGHQQFFSKFGPSSPSERIEVTELLVDGNASEMSIAIGWLPTMYSAQLISPITTTIAPFLTDDRHTVWRVPTPMKGVWKVIVYGNSQVPSGTLIPPYYLQGSLKSALTLHAFIDTPLADRAQGKPIHLVGLLTDQNPIVGASVNAVVTKPDGVNVNVHLFDDGLHGDGGANDGVYGGTFFQTGLAGSYPVLMKADGISPLNGPFHREALLAFHLDGDNGDSNDNRLPDGWEHQFPCIKSSPGGAQDDPDHDGLNNYEEFIRGTDPCNPDTDGDGIPDGSDRTPLEPGGQQTPTRPPYTVARPGIGKVWLKYVRLPEYKFIEVYRAAVITPALASRERVRAPNALDFELIGVEQAKGDVFTDTNAINGQAYCYYLVASDDADQRSNPLSPTCTTPNDDPIPPHGGILINNGAAATLVPTVTLTLNASDSVDPHNEGQYGDAFMLPPNDSASGVTDMMLSHRSDMEGGAWEAFATSKPWVLNVPSGIASVFVKFRDKTGNESEVYAASISVGANSAGLSRALMPIAARP